MGLRVPGALWHHGRRRSLAGTEMDIQVSSAEGLPPKAYLSVRSGELRKQAPYQKDLIFHFPSGPQGLGARQHSLTVDVFEHLGSCRASLPLGSTPLAQSQQVDLCIGHAAGNIQLGVTVTPTPAKPAAAAAAAADKSSGTNALQRAKSYLDASGVQVLLQEMVHMLLKKQPEDPMALMADFIDARRLKRQPEPGEVLGGAQRAAEPPGGATADAADGPPGADTGISSPKEESGSSQALPCPERLPDLSGHQNVAAGLLRLNPSLYYDLRNRRTERGATVALCLKPGVEAPAGAVLPTSKLEPGLAAADSECYEVFRELFDAVIRDCQWPHGEALPTQHSANAACEETGSAGAGDELLRLDPGGRHVLSIEVLASRCLEGLAFAPGCTRQERAEVERLIVGALLLGGGTPAGEATMTYFPLQGSNSYVPRPGGMSAAEAEVLRVAGLLPIAPKSQVELAAGAGSQWPEARGVCATPDNRLAVHVNTAAAHLEVRAQLHGPGVDLAACWRRTCSVVDALAQALERRTGRGFARSDRLGYLCADPSLVGSAVTAAATVRLPLLGTGPGLAKLCEASGVSFAVAAGGGGRWELRCAPRVGRSEADQLKRLAQVCHRAVELECSLEQAAQSPPKVVAVPNRAAWDWT